MNKGPVDNEHFREDRISEEPAHYRPKPEGDLEMKDGSFMPVRHAYASFGDIRSDLKTAERRAYLDDLYKVATGIQLPPERIGQFQRDLELGPDGDFLFPEKKQVLLLSYRKDADGTIHLDEPWKDTAANREMLKRIQAKEIVEMEDLVRRGGLTREGGGWSWDRN